MIKFDLIHGNSIQWAKSSYSSSRSYNDIEMSQVSIFNEKEKRMEKLKYVTKGIDYDIFLINDNQYKIVFHEKTNEMNFVSLFDGSIFLKEDIKSVQTLYIYCGFLFFSDINDNLFYLNTAGDIKQIEGKINKKDLVFSSYKGTEYNFTSPVRFKFDNNIDEKTYYDEFVYNIEDKSFVSLNKLKKYYYKDFSFIDSNILILTNNYILCRNKNEEHSLYSIYTYNFQKFIESSDSEDSIDLFMNKISYFVPFQENLGYGIIITSSKIYNFDKDLNLKEISQLGFERFSSYITSTNHLLGKYTEYNFGYRLLYIDEDTVFNIHDNKIYKTPFGDFNYNINIGVLEEGNGNHLIIDDFGLYGEGKVYRISGSHYLFKSNSISEEDEKNKLYIFGNNISFQPFEYENISNFEILSQERNDGVTNITLYSESGDKLYILNGDMYSGLNQVEKYDGLNVFCVPGNASEWMNLFNLKDGNGKPYYKLDTNIKKVEGNLIKAEMRVPILDDDNKKTLYYTEKTYYLLENKDNDLTFLGEDGFKKEKVGLMSHIPCYLFNNEIYFGNKFDESSKETNFIHTIKKLSEIDTYFSKNAELKIEGIDDFFQEYNRRNDFLEYEIYSTIIIEYRTKENKFKKRFIFIKESEKSNVMLLESFDIDPSYDMSKLRITPIEKFHDRAYSDLFIYRRTYIDENTKELVFQVKNKIERLPLHLYKIDTKKGNIEVNLFNRKNGDFFSEFPGIDDVKSCESVNDIHFKKIIQNNKKEYLINENLERVTKKDFNKIERVIGPNSLLVKQSGNTYICDFDGIPLTKKYKKFYNIIDGFDYYLNKYNRGEYNDRKMILNNFYLGSEDGINFKLLDHNLQELPVYGEDNSEILFNGTFKINWLNVYSIIFELLSDGDYFSHEIGENSFILETNNGKKVFFNFKNMKYTNRKTFDNIVCFNNGYYSGLNGRDLYAYDINDNQIIFDNYYDIIKGENDFLVVENRRDFLILSTKDGKPLNNQSYKEVYNSGDLANVIKVKDFNDGELYVSNSGTEYRFISEEYAVSKEGNGIHNLNMGEELFYTSDTELSEIEVEKTDMGIFIICKGINNEMFLINEKGEKILENKSKIICLKQIHYEKGIKDKTLGIYFLAKEFKKKFNIYNEKGVVKCNDIFTDFNYYNGRDDIHGKFSGIEVEYSLSKNKVFLR